MARGLLICTVIAAVSLLSMDSASAQRAGRIKFNQAFRFLGNGWSGGYHWRTPGYDVEYYNPYSQHNSRLKTGGIPQGASSYLSRMGGFDGAVPIDVSTFDQIGTFNQSGAFHKDDSYNFMPVVDYSTAPKARPSVVDSEVVDEASPRVDYRKGPETGNSEPRESILNRDKTPDAQPADRQPSPSDVPADKDGDVSMWKGFDELEALDNSTFAGGGR